MNAIETHALTRAFGHRTVVDQLTLAIPAGPVFEFLGPNDAAKMFQREVILTRGS